MPEFPIRCISKAEAFAEKFRAALTRREVAIRDFYDIDYGVTKLGLQSTGGEMVKLVRKKITVPGNDPVDVSDPRISALRGQLVARRRPVLRDRDFRQFDLDRAIGTVLQMPPERRRRFYAVQAPSNATMQIVNPRDLPERPKINRVGEKPNA